MGPRKTQGVLRASRFAARQDVVTVFAKIKENFQRLDVVFNNAGYGALGEVEGTPDDVARSVFVVKKTVRVSLELLTRLSIYGGKCKRTTTNHWPSPRLSGQTSSLQVTL